MKEIITISGVRGFIDENGVAQLNLEDSARGLGFIESKGDYVRWQRVENYLLEFGFSTCGERPEFIPENIFYRLAMKAKNETAEAFQIKVADEILPTIRRHGMYLTPGASAQAIETPEQFMARAILMAQETLQKKDVALQAAHKQIEAAAPKVLFADSVSASSTSILIGELAKILKQNGHEIGQNRLFEWLRENGYLISRKGTDHNMPTQRAMEMDLFTIKETVVNHSDGHVTVSKTPKVTGKGQIYFVNIFSKIGAAS